MNSASTSAVGVSQKVCTTLRGGQLHGLQKSRATCLPGQHEVPIEPVVAQSKAAKLMCTCNAIRVFSGGTCIGPKTETAASTWSKAARTSRSVSAKSWSRSPGRAQVWTWFRFAKLRLHLGLARHGQPVRRRAVPHLLHRSSRDGCDAAGQRHTGAAGDTVAAAIQRSYSTLVGDERCQAGEHLALAAFG